MAFFSPSLHPIAYPPSRSQSSSSVPRRSDSLAGKPSIFQLASDDLHDARRVLSHGQEEDLKTALLRVITRVEEMVRLSCSTQVLILMDSLYTIDDDAQGRLREAD
jgi:hypothetical protein